MPTAERAKEIQKELNKLAAEQVEADTANEQDKRDLADGKIDLTTYKERSAAYTKATNARGDDIVLLEQEQSET